MSHSPVSPAASSGGTAPARGKWPVRRKWMVAGLAVLVALAAYWILARGLSLDELAAHEARLIAWRDRWPLTAFAVAFAIYVLVTGFSIPGASAMSLVCGWFFGWLRGLVLVSFASTCGATIAFLLSRYLLRDLVRRRFAGEWGRVDRALEREGAWYLFTLRLIPAVPFFVINVLMGLSPLRATTFWWVSQLGMLPGTAAYVYAGSTVPSLAHLADPASIGVADVSDWSRLSALLSDPPSAPAAARVRSRLDDAALAALDRATDADVAARQAVAAALDRLLDDPSLSVADPTLHADRWPAPEEAPPDAAPPVAAPPVAAPPDAVPPDAAPPAAAAPPVDAAPSTATRRPAAMPRDKELTARNRQWLEAALDGTIDPPGSRLPPRLFVALAVLGILPLALKKFVERVRPPGSKQPPSRRDP